MTMQTPNRLIRALQRPGVLGPGTEEVRTLTTHMSWILLAGPHSYKIKRPVDLGFADFSTLEKRRHFCREDLRVNRRLAAEWYLEVVPICGSTEAPSVGGEGRPIEYAVKMKRFPQEARLDRILRRDELTPTHLDGLVQQIADFHGRVDVDADGRGFGTPDAVREPMEANFEHLAGDHEDANDAAQLERLRQWSVRQFRALHHDFLHRKREGFVRECHGDLHLGNMFLRGDSVVPFDAIEFNENLRWIDVLSELAFLAMDLEDRGRPDFARRVVNGYLEITGDYPGLTVLPYYLTYRAMVRAKVAGIRLEQKGLDESERGRLRRQRRGYLELAERYTLPPAPKLIVMHGVAGSGKTVASERLVEALGGIRLRSDVERKRLFELDRFARTGSELNDALYSPDTTRRCYARLAELAEAVVHAGFTAIVDAAFLARAQRRLLMDTAERLAVPLQIVHCDADEATLRRRVSRRETQGTDASEAGLEVLRHQLQAREPLSDGEVRASVFLDTADARWEEELTAAVCEGPGSQ